MLPNPNFLISREMLLKENIPAREGDGLTKTRWNALLNNPISARNCMLFIGIAIKGKHSLTI